MTSSDDSSSTFPPEEQSEKKWSIPSFIVRDYQYGYERECTDYLFGGENKKGGRQCLEEQLERVVYLNLKIAWITR